MMRLELVAEVVDIELGLDCDRLLVLVCDCPA